MSYIKAGIRWTDYASDEREIAAPLNWRDQPVITDHQLYQMERRVTAAEWHARRSLYPTWAAWHHAACCALEDIDLRFEEGQRLARIAFWADHDRRHRHAF